MPSEPNWLPITAVIEHNRLEAEATGERHFVRDRGLLESALVRPQNAFGAERIIALVEHRLAEEEFVAVLRPFVVAGPRFCR